MLLNLILGVNIDTPLLVKKLIETNTGSITAVLDYDLEEAYTFEQNAIVISPSYAQDYIIKFKKVVFHKSLNIYPTIK